jgi:hypothetical protein
MAGSLVQKEIQVQHLLPIDESIYPNLGLVIVPGKIELAQEFSFSVLPFF